MTKPTVPAFALLPVRIFFGVTFLWAGLDKLLDPTFFDSAAPASLHAQLETFARQSPLGELIRASLPLTTPIGLTIAIGELAVGIGTLTGLAFRLAAAGGAALSLLFWLTASWPTHPYYFGADLPYLAGWIALALAGHGDLLVSRRLSALVASASRIGPRDGVPRARRPSSKGTTSASWRASSPPVRAAPRTSVADRTLAPDRPPSPERRLLLEAGALAGVAALVALVTAPLRALGIASEPRLTPSASPGPRPTPVAIGSASPGAGSGDLAIARIVDVQRAGSAAFNVPFDAPAPLPAGDPGLVIELRDHSFVAFDAVCTHAGCTVAYDAADGVILCPCHGAAFDPAHDAAVIDGPTRTPLTRLPLVVDEATGTIRLSTS